MERPCRQLFLVHSLQRVSKLRNLLHRRRPAHSIRRSLLAGCAAAPVAERCGASVLTSSAAADVSTQVAPAPRMRALPEPAPTHGAPCVSSRGAGGADLAGSAARGPAPPWHRGPPWRAVLCVESPPLLRAGQGRARDLHPRGFLFSACVRAGRVRRSRSPAPAVRKPALTILSP